MCHVEPVWSRAELEFGFMVSMVTTRQKSLYHYFVLSMGVGLLGFSWCVLGAVSCCAAASPLASSRLLLPITHCLPGWKWVKEVGSVDPDLGMEGPLRLGFGDGLFEHISPFSLCLYLLQVVGKFLPCIWIDSSLGPVLFPALILEL